MLQVIVSIRDRRRRRRSFVCGIGIGNNSSLCRRRVLQLLKLSYVQQSLWNLSKKKLIHAVWFFANRCLRTLTVLFLGDDR